MKYVSREFQPKRSENSAQTFGAFGPNVQKFPPKRSDFFPPPPPSFKLKHVKSGKCEAEVCVLAGRDTLMKYVCVPAGWDALMKYVPLPGHIDEPFVLV